MQSNYLICGDTNDDVLFQVPSLSMREVAVAIARGGSGQGGPGLGGPGLMGKRPPEGGGLDLQITPATADSLYG